MAVIVPNSEVRLIKNVPFSNNYRNVILFNSKQAQETYFKSLPSLIKEDFKYQRNNGTIMYPSDRDTVLQYNYLMFKNKAYSDKYFYAFITNVSYVNPNTCAISFELDVFQSWFLDVNFQPSYIERQHCKRWNSDGTPVINTVPESLEFGTEYNIVSVETSSAKTNKGNMCWLIFGIAFDKEDFPNYAEYFDNIYNGGTYDSLQYLAIPFNPNAISTTHYTVNNKEVSVENILEMFRYNAVFSGKLKTLYITDFVPLKYSISGNTITTENLTWFKVYQNLDHTIETSLPFVTFATTDYLDYQYLDIQFNSKYDNLKTSKITESKLLMYPYSMSILEDFQGNSFIIKNEYVNTSNIRVRIRSAIGVSNKVAYTLLNYLGSGIADGYLYLDNGIICNEPNRLTTIDDYTSAYIQGNMNTIEQGVNANKQQSLLNNTIARNNANTSSAVTSTRNSANMGQAVVSGTAGIVSGFNADVIGALNSGGSGYMGIGTGGGLAKGIGGVINAGIQNSANMKVTNLENANMIQNTTLRGELSNQLAIAGANAKIQDARNIADNVTLQGGNAQFNYGYHNIGCKLIKKQITKEYIDILQNYFSRYGYAYHRMEVPNLKSRENWNYIQTVGANIIGNIPQLFIDALEGLFNSGITLWHTTDVGNYSLPNDEV